MRPTLVVNGNAELISVKDPVSGTLEADGIIPVPILASSVTRLGVI
jgi:hypothetical protein